MNVLFSYDKQRVDTYDALVEALPDDAVASPTRSTIPLVSFWADPKTRAAEFAERLRFDLPASIELHFEYAVPPPAGRGKASFTDVMLVAPNVALSIEAKFSEPKYETVAAWLERGDKQNRAD